jgi:hypothetical protein
MSPRAARTTAFAEASSDDGHVLKKKILNWPMPFAVAELVSVPRHG